MDMPHNKIQNIINANFSNIDAIMLDCADEKIAQFYFVDKSGNNVFENTDLPLKKFGFHFYRQTDKKYNGLRFYIPTVEDHFISILLPTEKPYKINNENLSKNVYRKNKDFIKLIATFAVKNSISLEKTVTKKLHEQNVKMQVPAKPSQSKQINK